MRIRRYKNQMMQNAYENACDCHKFGMLSSEWEDCGIPSTKRNEVWAVAWYDMGDGYEEHGKRTIKGIMRLMRDVY